MARKRRALIARDGARCYWCEDPSLPLTVDHVLPRAWGGANAVENLVLACEPCNARRGLDQVKGRLYVPGVGV